MSKKINIMINQYFLLRISLCAVSCILILLHPVTWCILSALAINSIGQIIIVVIVYKQIKTKRSVLKFVKKLDQAGEIDDEKI